MNIRSFDWNGEHLQLEPWATHVARDKRGRWHQFDREPKANNHRGMFMVERGSLQSLLTKTGIADLNWRDSLVEVDVILKPVIAAVKKRKEKVATKNNSKSKVTKKEGK